MASIAFAHTKMIGTLLPGDDLSAVTNPMSAPTINPGANNGLNSGIQAEYNGSAALNPFGLIYNGITGVHVAFSATKDFSTHQFIRFNATGEMKYVEGYTLPYDQGGMSIGFVDSLGNFKEFAFYGGEQYLAGYRNGGSPDTLVVCMDKGAPTFSESATPLDWSDIVGFEFYARGTINEDLSHFGIGSIVSFDTYVLTGGDATTPASFADFKTTQIDPEVDALSSSQWDYGDWNYASNFLQPSEYFDGGVGELYSVKAPFSIGDGVTTTVFVDNGSLLNFYPDAPFRSGRDEKTYMKLNNGDRWFKDTLSTACVRELQGTVLSCENKDACIGFYGTTNIAGSFYKDVGFYQFYKLELLSNVEFADCLFVGVYSIAVNTDTIASGRITGSTDNGLVIDSVGDYSKLEIEFDASNTRDITLQSAPGSIDLTGAFGTDLKIHNATANDVTVLLALGQTSTITTDGGVVTIESPIIYDIAETIGIEPGSRLQIFNQTKNTEVANEIVTVDWSISYERNTSFSKGDIVRIRATYANGANFLEPVETFVSVGASGFSALVDQVPWAVVNNFAIDGSTVGEFSINYLTLHANITDPGGMTTKRRLVAWYAYTIFAEPQAIDKLFGAFTPEDSANIRINKQAIDLKIHNLNAQPVIFTDDMVRLYTDDGSTLFATEGGSIFIESGRIYIADHGFTPDELADSVWRYTRA
ncbi:MAG: hypothetical protein PF440_06330 [Thiomicrorhabdus sp.]|jgi:hypothetical protein|nr:hypothetical protein [Thiomicrorhabdus sp.]